MNQSIIKYYYGDYGDKEQVANNNESSKSGARSADLAPLGESKGTEWPLWEVFIRSKQGLDHKHVGSLHAADAQMAIENARDVYTRRQEGVSIWVVESKCIHASNPDDAESFYEPANDKVYRHPTFYDLPDELTHM
jgi:ring-1,2-phenylacetyl-CoA epoxidase subunit PaaB